MLNVFVGDVVLQATSAGTPTTNQRMWTSPAFQRGKLNQHVLESHRAGDTVKSGSLMKKAIGRCPCAEVLVGSGIRINCLLDTGAQVSTIRVVL